MSITSITSLVVLVLAFAGTGIILINSIFSVGPRELRVITRMGKYMKVCTPGLNFKIPFIHWKGPLLDLSQRSVIDKAKIKTKDDSYVEMPLTIFYRINPEMPEEAAYRVNDPQGKIKVLGVKMMKTKSSDLTMDELFTDTNAIKDYVTDNLNNEMKPDGFIIDDVIVEEPAPSQILLDASNRVKASIQNLAADKNEAKSIRIKEVGQAEADAASLELRTGAFANSRKGLAQGLSDAVKVCREDDSMKDLSTDRIIEILEGIDKRDAMISCSKNGSTIIMGQDSSESRGIAEIISLIKTEGLLRDA